MNKNLFLNKSLKKILINKMIFYDLMKLLKRIMNFKKMKYLRDIRVN
ncbi:hypothetical protein M8044_000004 [Columbia Basin potato purple top phytoplasma]|uniref:Uncharacterized protein n=1 Tax=Columbia Basin potato purple top phytoplasma TaxID=307134 RepID=A0ABT5L7U6_9MOLU|nr:hypothetical protein [Columbia Basin potato purple top phytoplasma]